MNLFGGVLTLDYDAAELALGAFALLALLDQVQKYKYWFTPRRGRVL
jgi:hypothetical protein